MSWRSKVRVAKPEGRPPIWRPEPGEHLVRILDEPEGPAAMRYGLRLPLTIQLVDSGDIFTWLVPWREETSERSLLGQLKAIAEEHDGLEGLMLKVDVQSIGGRRRYEVSAVEHAGGGGLKHERSGLGGEPLRPMASGRGGERRRAERRGGASSQKGEA